MSRAITAQELSMRTSIPAILPTRHDVPNIAVSSSQPLMTWCTDRGQLVAGSFMTCSTMKPRLWRPPGAADRPVPLLIFGCWRLLSVLAE
jgi:hypothetical protein